ncbi:platelet-activating factor acetylhydrolase [Fusarium coicis]|nr:platelet-activating factor acetylhydrolase [Fusarium coicis]
MRLLALLTFLRTSRALLVPSPPGPYNVAVKNFELIDTNRIDTFAPNPDTKRRLVVSAYLPIDSQYGCKDEVVPYVPALTAEAYGKVAGALGLPDNIVKDFEMKVCNISSVKPKRFHKPNKDYPVALFSPGYQGSRLVYGAMARSLASLGYIILTVDHTYEAFVVEFPDGTAATAAEFPDNMNSTYRQLEVRTKDESFVISQLCNHTLVEQVFGDFPGTFNPDKVAVYGHSFGGSTAAVTAQRDSRVIGGLNFDGPMYGSVVQDGLKRTPYILVGTNMTAPDPVPGWNAFYDKIDAPKMEMVVKHTRHYTFTDVPLLLTEFKVPAESEAMVHNVFGTLGGRKVEKAANEIMVAFLDLVFKKDDEKLQVIGKKDGIHVLQRDFA